MERIKRVYITDKDVERLSPAMRLAWENIRQTLAQPPRNPPPGVEESLALTYGEEDD